MQSFLVAAGVLALVTAVVHSVLGELLIFRHLRNTGVVPSVAAPPVQARSIRIIWATRHLASLFGLAFAAVLFQMALDDSDRSLRAVILRAIVFANLGGASLVLVGTRGRHPGSIALLLVAVLAWLALRAA